MKRVITFLLLAAMAVTLWGCKPKSIVEKGDQQVSSIDVVEILVRHFPESEDYERTYTNPEKIKEITDHIANLALEAAFDEDPDE